MSGRFAGGLGGGSVGGGGGGSVGGGGGSVGGGGGSVVWPGLTASGPAEDAIAKLAANPSSAHDARRPAPMARTPRFTVPV
jgi:hypothetical protein